MRNKITLLILLLGLCLPISAQIYTDDYDLVEIKENVTHAGPKYGMIYGVMAGVNVPVMSDKQNVVDIDNTAGYQVGIMWGIDMGALEIVPEIWYQHSKSKVYHNNYDSEGDLVSNSIEMPIVVAMNFAKIMRFNLGPSFSLMSNAEYRPIDSNAGVSDFGQIKSTVGYVVGLSATITERFIIDARYTGRFVSVDSEWHSGASEHEYRYYNYSFNIGYRF